MAAPVYEAGDDQYVGGGNAASLVVTKPAGVAVGQAVYVSLYKENSDAVTATGFTLEDSTNTGNFWLYVYSRVIDGSEGATFTLSWSGSTWRSGTISRVSGNHATTPTNAHNAAATTGSDSTSEPVSVTTTVADCLLVHWPACFSSGNWTPSASFTEHLDNGNEQEVASLVQAGTGSSGSVVATTSASNRNAAILVAVAPAAGGGGGGDAVPQPGRSTGGGG